VARSKIKLNHAEVGRILREDMREPIDELAAAIADAVEIPTHPDAEIMVRSYTTDRAAAAVSIAEAYGLNVEAVHGPLRKAAASLGLDVKSKKPGRSK